MKLGLDVVIPLIFAGFCFGVGVCLMVTDKPKDTDTKLQTVVQTEIDDYFTNHIEDLRAEWRPIIKEEVYDFYVSQEAL